MNKLLIILFFISTSIFPQLDLSAQNINPHQRIQFRNLPWGMPLDNFYVNGEKVTLKEHKRKTTTDTFPYDFKDNVYTLPKDKMTIGAAKLQRIYYVFDKKDRFNKVVLYGEGSNYADIDFILRHKFGKADYIETLDGVKVKNWNVGDVDFMLRDLHLQGHFELVILGNWRSDKDFLKNLSVRDF